VRHSYLCGDLGATRPSATRGAGPRGAHRGFGPGGTAARRRGHGGARALHDRAPRVMALELGGGCSATVGHREGSQAQIRGRPWV
jgi:hypothetical protein